MTLALKLLQKITRLFVVFCDICESLVHIKIILFTEKFNRVQNNGTVKNASNKSYLFQNLPSYSKLNRITKGIFYPFQRNKMIQENNLGFLNDESRTSVENNCLTLVEFYKELSINYFTNFQFVSLYEYFFTSLSLL